MATLSRLSKAGTAVVVALALCASLAATQAAEVPDPFASNNGFYPAQGSDPPPIDGPYQFRVLSRNYPTQPPAHSWLEKRPKGAITRDNAAAYAARLKAYVAPTLRKMIEAPAQWDPAANRWYDMPWMGQTDSPGDSTGGRDALLGSFSGQVILAKSQAHGALKVDTQNHTVIYYDPLAALTLADVWKNAWKPNKVAAVYRDGALVVKAGGVAATAEEWPVVAGAAEWRVYRPPVQQVIDHRSHPDQPYTPVVTPLRVLQFDIIVKDTEAAPETGWVFVTFVYDKDAPKGTGPWDQLVPLGVTWGNDPQFDDNYLGHPPVDPKNPDTAKLKQFWRNTAAPAYANATLGWGGRMSGPIDIAERHGLILTEDVKPGEVKTDAECDAPQYKPIKPTGPFRASGCFSCHGTSQSVGQARMYPSPVSGHLPMDGQPFCLYKPGTAEWARWFQNRPGTQPENPTITEAAVAAVVANPAASPFVRLNPRGAGPIDAAVLRRALKEPARGLDYDMLLMFALSTAEASTQNFSLLPERTAVH